MLQDGRTYRTQEAHERLQAICAKLGNPEFAERAFGENHAASIMAKEWNGWKPLQPQPSSSQTSRRPAWSTATAASGTGWVMTRGIINHPGLDPSSVDTFQRVCFCLPCQMKCISTLTLEALSIFSRRHFHFFFLFSCVY